MRQDLFPRAEESSFGSEPEIDITLNLGSDTRSTEEFKNIFKHEQRSEDSIRSSDITSPPPSYVTNDAYSLRLSILENMDPDVESNDRFKYLRMYENLQRQQDDTNSTYSVFGLSNLDDFSNYIKQTEINEIIRTRLNNANANGNILQVLNSRDLKEKFDANDNFKDSDYGGARVQETSVKNNLSGSGSFSEFSEISDSSEKSSSTTLHRKLKIRHLQMISFGGTLGVGLYLNLGKAITIAGGFGCLLAFIVCGIIVLSTLFSFCEMVTFVSVVDGVSGLSSRFVDDAFGFSVGWLYFLSFATGLAGEVVASVIMLNYYPNLKILTDKGSSAGFVTLFLGLIFLCNILDVRVFGEIEYFSSFIKLLWAFAMIILMIVINTGGAANGKIGFKYWDYSKSDLKHNLAFGLFRPAFNLHDTGTSPLSEGIHGNLGRFLSFMVALMVCSYAYSGTEIVCIAAGEAKNPRKAIPSATKRVFWRILFFYCLSAFVVSLNVYAGDPRLLRYYLGEMGVAPSKVEDNYAIKYVGGSICTMPLTLFAGVATGSQSPWVVAVESAGICGLTGVVNGFLIFFAVSCGNAQLYVSSRTLYSLALQNKAPKCMTYCSSSGVPYWSVLFSAAFGLLSYLCVSQEATVVFQNLSSVVSSSGILLWFAMCLAFVRFYHGLKKRPDIINRNDKAYPYKSPFQPLSAYIGLFGSTVLLLGNGFVVFLKGEWNTWFFFSSYGTLIFFTVLYVGYKIVRGSGIHSLETLDYDTGRREIDRYIYDGTKEGTTSSMKEWMHRLVAFLV